ncbi:9103_t:CDS:2, partial [Diversispora eburnea]
NHFNKSNLNISRLTKSKNRSMKACEGKAAHRFKRIIDDIDYDNIDELESPNIDELKGTDINNSFNDCYNGSTENNNAVNIVTRLQEVSKKYHKEHASHKVRKSLYIGNSSCTTRRKNHQQCEVAKGTFTLHTFWNTKESTEEINNDDDDLLDDEIENCNWNNEISTVLENLDKVITNAAGKGHKWNVTPQILMIQINEVILPGLEFVPSPTIHINTARNYLKELGYSYEK